MPSLIAVLGFDTGPFNKGMDAAQSKARSGGKGIESAFGGLGKSLAGFASVGAVTAAISSTIEYGSKINDLSLRLGISTDAVQEWDYALKQNGSSIDAAVGFFEKLGVNRKKALEGNETAIASFDKLGVSLDDLKTKRVEDIAAQISQAFKTGDPQALIADLREVGGRGAGEMIATFTAGFDELSKQAHALGIIISKEVVVKLDDAGDALDRMKAQGQGMFAPMVAGLSMALGYVLLIGNALRTGVIEAVGDFMGKVAANPLTLLNPLEWLKSKSLMLPAAANYLAESKAAEDAAKAAKDSAAAKKPVDLGDDKLSEKEQKEAEKAVKEAAREADRAAKETDRLAAREQAAEQAAEAKATADAAKQLATDTKEGAAFGKHSVNAQQQLGAFFGNYASAGAATAPELAALNVQIQSERHLAQIVKLLSGGDGSNQTAF